MMNKVENKTPEVQSEEQEIDLFALATRLWENRKFLLKCVGVAVIVALIVAFSIPKVYTTTVTLAPEMSESSQKMGGLGGLAAMAGVDLRSSSGMDAISPDLYPNVVLSSPFLLELFPVIVKNQEGTMDVSLYDYLFDYQKKPWWGYIVDAPFKTLSWFIELFTGKEDSEEEVNPFHLTKNQEKVIKTLKENIGISVDKKNFVITVSIQMQDPLISAQLANVVVDKLQGYITTYRTQKAKQDLLFTQKVFKEAREAYYKAQKAYAVFEDANKNIITATYRTEQERLRNDMTLTFNVYNTLAQRLEQDKLKVQEQTPVYTVLEPARVPLKASSPKKMMILLGAVFFALLGGVGFLFIKDKSL